MRLTRHIALMVMAGFATFALAQQGQNQPIYDPNDPIGDVLPPNIYFLVDISGSMSAKPGSQSSNYDPIGNMSNCYLSKIHIAKTAITTLMNRGLRVRWSLFTYSGNSAYTNWSGIRGSYTSACYTPDTNLYVSGGHHEHDPVTLDTEVLTGSNCTLTLDRLLTPIYHYTLPANPTADQQYEYTFRQWFKSSADTGYTAPVADIKEWVDLQTDDTGKLPKVGSMDWMFLKELIARGSTPIQYSLQSILRYTHGKNYTGGTGVPAHYYDYLTGTEKNYTPYESVADPYFDCRYNAALVLTDGVCNCGSDPTGEARSAAAALHTNNVHTMVVGLSSTESKTILDNLAVSGGTEHAYFADNTMELVAELVDAIGAASGSEFSGDTEPVLGFVPPTSIATWPATMPATVKAQNVVYKTSTAFSPIFGGRLRAYQALTTNAADPTEKIDFLTDFTKESAYRLWDAADVIPASASRKIYFGTSAGTLSEFTTSPTNRTAIAAAAGLGSLTTTEVDAFINWVRDQGLGDFLYSTPAYVGPPDPNTYSNSEYQAWANSTAIVNRSPMIIAGANDGMLHCFSGVTGAELWAYVPPNAIEKPTSTGKARLYTELYASGTGNTGQPDVKGVRVYNRRPHYYYVSSSPKVMNIRTTSGTWKTVCVFGLGAGGREYYCLDITNSAPAITNLSGTFTAPSLLWRFSGSTSNPLGETWSVPALGVFGPVSTSHPRGRFCAVMGSGFNLTPPADATMGKTLFVVDLETGVAQHSYTLTDSTVTTFGASSTTLVSTIGNCLFSPPVLFDSPTDGDGFIDAVYFGDYSGKLYRMAVDKTSIASSTTVTLFTTKNGSPIYCMPYVAELYVTNAGKRTLIAFSEYGKPIDTAATPVVNSRLAGVTYMLVEEKCPEAGGVLHSDLVATTGSNSSFSLTSDAKGFYFEMPNPSEGESTLFRPSIFWQTVNGTGYYWMGFSSYSFFPNASGNTNCDPVNHTVNAGKSRPYVINLLNANYYASGTPTDLDPAGDMRYGRASGFHKGARGEAWMDIGTGDVWGWGLSTTQGKFAKFSTTAANVTYDMAPVSGVEVLNSYWREFK